MSDSKLLVSGNGIGNPEISTSQKDAVIHAVGNTTVCLFAFWFSTRGFPIFWTMTEFILAVVFGAQAALALYFRSHISKIIEATNINVYEDGIKGVVVDKDFAVDYKLICWSIGWNKAKLISFDFAFKQISSVTLEDNAIIINASGMNYKCFVSNGSEIQTAINNKIRNVS